MSTKGKMFNCENYQEFHVQQKENVNLESSNKFHVHEVENI